MAIEFLKPKISIQELKLLVIKLRHNDTDSINGLFQYQQEFSSHYVATCLQLTEEQNLKNYMSHSKNEELHDEIKAHIEDKTTLKEERFGTLQHRLILLIEDLITLLTDNGLDDRSMGDIDITFGE